MSIKVGLIGAGAITTPHLAAFVRHPEVEQVAVADPSEEARQQKIEEFGIIKQEYDDHRELLEDDNIDVVDICTPHYLHEPQAIDAMEAGKHVILEKPMALTVEECDHMIQVSEKTDRRLMCALCMRRMPAHMRAKQLIEDGSIGEPFLGAITVIGDEFERMNDPDSWKGDRRKAGGGAMFDTGYHAIYMLQHFFGQATAATMTAKRLVVEPDNKGDDNSVLSLEFDDDVLGSVVITYSATGDRWSEERRIVGTDGSILVRDDPLDEMPLIVMHGDSYQPIRVKNPPGIHRYAVREIVTEFLDCMVYDRETDVTIDEARAAVATVTAAYRSAEEGRRVEIET